jgi:hypothetical protein
MGSNPANCTKHFFTNTIYNFVIVTELVYLHSRMIFKKVKITFKIYSTKHSPGVEPQFSDLNPDALPLHHLYFSQIVKNLQDKFKVAVKYKKFLFYQIH